MDAGGDGFVSGFVLEPVADCEELNGVARGLRGLNVVGGDIRDAFAVHVVGGDAGVEGEGCEDGGFGCGVVAFHIGGGVGFGVAESGSLGEHVVVGGTGGVHSVEDEVGGAIDDAGDGLDLITGKGAAERPNNGNGCGDGSFEVKVDTGLVGGLGEFGRVGRDERLVGGNNGFAAAESAEHEFARVVDAADDFDHEVYVVAFDEATGIVGEEPQFVGEGADMFFLVRHGHAADFERAAGAVGELVGVFHHEAEHLGADGAVAEDSNADGGSCAFAGVEGGGGHGCCAP